MEEAEDQNKVIKIWTRISDETSVRIEMIGHINKAIIKERKKKIQITSKNATQIIIQDLINDSKKPVKKILEHNGIERSADFGVIVRKLCEEKLMRKEAHDNYEDFNGLFETATIEDYLQKEGIKKKKDWIKIVCNSLYVIGFIIVVSSYIIDIPYLVGWAGWGIGMLGWLILFSRNRIKK